MIFKRLFLIFFLTFSLSIVALPTFAADTGASNKSDTGASNPANPGASNPSDPGASNPSLGGKTIQNPLKFPDLKTLLDGILNAVITLGEIVLTLAIIWIGFLFVAARGNEEKIRTARSALIWTVIGGLILLGAKGIETVIFSTVGSITS